jgi:propanol-preferring alcohol dehydrogenase
MRAMILEKPTTPLQPRELPIPEPAEGEVLLRVHACGVCRTDLHILDGELTQPRLPLIPGHQIVGSVVATGRAAGRFTKGDRVGVPWLGSTCGSCRYCLTDRENLCERAVFTGYTRDGGFAEYAVADERFCFAIPQRYEDLQAAPLLCAGLIGYRALAMAGESRRLGFYGFGSAAHILTQVAAFQGREVYAFTRPGDAAGQAFARRLGAVWAGDSTTAPPVMLDSAIIFAPSGGLVPAALASLDRGGSVICAGIHMSDIPAFAYRLLWEERSIRSVANLTRQDGREFLSLAGQVPIQTEVTALPLEQANEALQLLRGGAVNGSLVLSVDIRK